MIFAFDSVRNFSSLKLFVANFHAKTIGVFSEVKVHFSLTGLEYSPIVLKFTYIPQTFLG